MAIIIVFIVLMISVYFYQYPRNGKWWLFLNERFRTRRLSLESMYADLGDVSICYYDSSPVSGNKPTLLLIHGFSSDRTSWLPLLALLTRHFRVVVPDLPNHGQSEAITPSLFTTEILSKLLWQFVAQITEEPVHLVGHSLGGKITAHMAMMTPTKVASLTLIGPAGFKSSIPSTVEKLIKAGSNPFAVRTRDEYRAFRSLLMTHPPYLPSIVRDFMADKYIESVDEMATLFNTIAPTGKIQWQALSQLSLPILILWGKEDKVVDASAVNACEANEWLAIQVFKDCGHTPQQEQPVRTAWAMLWFYHRHFKMLHEVTERTR